MSRAALIAGGSGLVGRHLLGKLFASPAYGRVVAVGRRRIPAAHAKFEQIVCSFDDFTRGRITGAVDDAYCCLGTTLKDAGSKEAFRRVDFDYALKFARIAQDAGAERFVLVSSIGASARSWVFYSRVKGEIEEAVKQLGFAATAILRPAGLLGERSRPRLKERVGETLLKPLTPLLRGPLRKYRFIAADAVAEAAIRLGLSPAKGARILESDALQALADAPGTVL